MTGNPALPNGNRSPAAPVPVASITWEQWHEARSDTKRAMWMSYVVLAMVAAHLAATFALYDRVGELGATVGVLSATVDDLSGAVERIGASQQEVVTRIAAADGRMGALEERLDTVEARLGALENGVADISRLLADMRDDIRRGSLLMPGVLPTVAPPWTPEILEDYLVARVDADDMRGVVLYGTADRQWYLATAPGELFSLSARPPSVPAAVGYANAPDDLRSYVEEVLGLPARQ